MTSKHYGYTTSVLFAIIGAVHLWRGLAGWPVTIGAQVVPIWPSWLALAVAGYLAWQGCRVARRV